MLTTKLCLTLLVKKPFHLNMLSHEQKGMGWASDLALRLPTCAAFFVKHVRVSGASGAA